MGLVHNHNHRNNEVKSKNIILAVILNFIIAIIEIIGGLLSNSFALLSDALHNFGDAIAIFLTYISNRISKRSPTIEKTFGFKRVEILAAMINSIGMVVICVYLILQAFERLKHPRTDINGVMIVIIAALSLIANFIAIAFLFRDKNKNLNVKAAYLHMLGDVFSSAIVLLGGIFIYRYKIFWLDAVLTFIIGIYIFKEAWYILKQAYLILIQATPGELDLIKVKNRIESFIDVENVHHIHAWNLNDSQIHFECHIDLNNDLKISETENILYKIKQLLKEDFNIAHTTVQFEYNSCDDKSIIKNI